MTREQLIAHAARLGIPRPRVLTQPELIDEIIGRTATSEPERVKARGWLGRARDLLANVVEKGLHLPEAARLLRQEEKSWPAPPPPLPTVTLAEIYAAQGHYERAIAVIDEVLGREPDHREARSLRERFVDQLQRSRARAGRVDVPPAPPPPVKDTKLHKPVKQAPSDPPLPARADDPPAPVEPVIAEAAVIAAEPAADASEPVIDQAAADAATSDDEAGTPIVAGEEMEDAPPVEAEEPAAIEPAANAIEPAANAIEPAANAIEPAASVIEPAATAIASEIPRADPAPTPVELEPQGEPPLPQRYEVDEVVAIAVDPRTIYLYWEVRPTTLARARAARPGGALCLRLASVTASWEGPVIDSRDLRIDAVYGDRFVRDVQPGSNVRVSLGWKTGDDFEPLAVGAEVTAPRAVPVESVADEVARWEEEPVAPFTSWRPEHTPPPPPSADDRVFAPFVPRSVSHVPWAPSITAPHETSAGHGAPVDTGVAVWGPPAPAASAAPAASEEAEPPLPRLELFEREIIIEEPWFIGGGSSELSQDGVARSRIVRVQELIPGGPGGPGDESRGGPGDGAGGESRGGSSELSRGGSNELSRGGSSELSRGGASELSR